MEHAARGCPLTRRDRIISLTGESRKRLIDVLLAYLLHKRISIDRSICQQGGEWLQLEAAAMACINNVGFSALDTSLQTLAMVKSVAPSTTIDLLALYS